MSMFHIRLRALKAECKETQAAIASAIGITPQAFSYYLNNREPSFDILCKLATYFNTSTDYLLGLSEYKKPQEAFELYGNSESSNDDHKSYWAISLYRKAKPVFNNISDIYATSNKEAALSEMLYKHIDNTLGTYSEALEAISDRRLNSYSDIISTFVSNQDKKEFESTAITELAKVYCEIHGDSAKV